MLLSLYTACVLLPLLCLLGLMLRLIWKRHLDALLCTECQSCIARCPVGKRGLVVEPDENTSVTDSSDAGDTIAGNAYDIIRWAKTGSTADPNDPMLRRLQAACGHCGLCHKDCPRGLSPHALLPPLPKPQQTLKED